MSYGHGGLTPGERRIMDLWDADVSTDRIARQLQIPKRTVCTVVANFHSGDDDRRRHADMARGTRLLLAAIGQAYPERIAA